MTKFKRNIGILGAGQLGRMLALAGTPLGCQFGFYGSDPTEPAAILGHFFNANSQPLDPLVEFAEVISYESENTSVELVKKIAQHTPVYPSATSLYYSQDRGREKSLFDQLNIPCAPYRLIDNLDELEQAVDQLGLPAVLKTTTEGYDGKGQAVIKSKDQMQQAWLAIGERPAILEGFIQFKRELSIIAVRNADNQHVFYPLVENQHRDGILRLTLAPAEAISEPLQRQAENYMQALLDEMDHIGVLTLELFETEQGLVVNEMAPRVHNSGHWTIEGAETSQFENHIRAISGMPLGSTSPRQSHAAMINIIGEIGEVEKVLSLPNAHLHLYDKAERKARKLGHITLLANSQAEREKQLEQLKDWLI
ncbi:5-(carboxyamino)imidazole ribonucleotide synthase [Thiomicrospira microaerophila]|uniref:5-(carboxyamino)imidazole ribonucleotide synthase n=1 Tax=Thiomicrospira microaerophila TaxID=406020 RepID=UPI00200F9948|nr:5-(carboxyamino)imidazole ribonucleotide synthase [Thiomicrospira microaerophila]UQB41629.1 5-(carboxyamino)imidazole ribonucleotide synthase [Thiomicrospira microaerophila]